MCTHVVGRLWCDGVGSIWRLSPGRIRSMLRWCDPADSLLEILMTPIHFAYFPLLLLPSSHVAYTQSG